MKNKMLKKIVCSIVANLFLVNSVVYGLSPVVPSSTMGEAARGDTRNGMYVTAEKLFSEKITSSTRELVEVIKTAKGSAKSAGVFEGSQVNVPEVRNFRLADYSNLPENLRNDPIYKETDFSKAFKRYLINEAGIPEDRFEIREDFYRVKENAFGIARTHLENGKLIITVHANWKKVWNFLRKHDILYTRVFADGQERTVSLALSVFFRVAKHEVSDIAKDTALPKSWGHLTYIPGTAMDGGEGRLVWKKTETHAPVELITNQIQGRYNIDNDAAWMYILGAFLQGDEALYDDAFFTNRLRTWLGKDGEAKYLHAEFPNLIKRDGLGNLDFTAKGHWALNLARALNYNVFHLYSEKGFTVPAIPPKDAKWLELWEEMSPRLRNACISAGLDSMEALLGLTDADLRSAAGAHYDDATSVKLHMLLAERRLTLKGEVLKRGSINFRVSVRHANGWQHLWHLKSGREGHYRVPGNAVVVDVWEHGVMNRSVRPGTRLDHGQDVTITYDYIVTKTVPQSTEPAQATGGKEFGARPVASVTDTKEFWQLRQGAHEAVKDHPFIRIISEMKVPLEKDMIPGNIKLSRTETQNIWQMVNRLNDSQIEILLPQQVKLTETMKRALRDIRKRKGQNIIKSEEYSSGEHLKKLLSQKTPPNVKRIVLTEKAMSSQMRQLVEANPELFKGNRLLNIALPTEYATMNTKEKTFYQARMVMTAMLARLYERNETPMVEFILTEILTGCVDIEEGGISGFLNRLAESDNENVNPNIIKERILYCLDKAVSFMSKLAEEMERVRLMMREFYTSA